MDPTLPGGTCLTIDAEAPGDAPRARSRRAISSAILALILGASFPTSAPAQAEIPIDWECSGPYGGNVSGFTRAVGPAGQHLVAATYGGGIYASDDLGATWTLSQGLTSFFMTSVATSPLSPNVLFAGVEDQETYIPQELRSKLVKSTDGGLTWFESSTGIQNNEGGRSIPTAVAASTTDMNVVYAGCVGTPWPWHAPRFYRSTDAGSTWLAAETGHSGYSYAISVHPGDGNTLLSASDFGVYWSADGAASWTFSQFSSGTVEAVLIMPAAPQVAVAGDPAGVQRSTDGGATWSPVTGPGAPTSLVTCLALEPATALLYAGTDHEGLFVSSDLGASWSPVGPPGPPLASITSLAVLGPHAALPFIAGTNYRGVYRSADGHAWAWSSQGLKASVARACKILADGVVLAGIEELGIARCAVGQDWVYAPGIAERETIVSFGDDPHRPDTLFAGASSGALYRSIDRGATWAAFSTFPGSVNAVGFDGQTLGRMYACVFGDSFYVSTNSGLTWKGHWFGGGGYLGLGVDPLDGARLLVTAHTAMYHGIYKSTDAGENWALKEPIFPTNTIAFDPSDTSYAYCGGALDFGVWRSTDAGESWDILTGFPGGPGHSYVAIDPSRGSDPWAAKTAFGVYLARNHGETWLGASGDLVNRWFYGIGIRDVEGHGAMAAVCTNGAGVHIASDVAAGAGGPWAPPALLLRRVIAVPNPFRAGVGLRLEPALAGPASIRIFDPAGRLVRELEVRDAQQVVWDGIDASGRPAAAGGYLIRASAGSTFAAGKAVRIR